jgi:DNA-binding PadR family transcriptional regulator
MRTPELKKTILRMAGKKEFYGYEMHKKLEKRDINIGIGRLYSILGEMKQEGFLKDRWEKSQNGPKRRVYQTGEKGIEERNRILMDAIKTIHEFYTEYLLGLPPEHSVFNMMSDQLISDLQQNSNIAYAATRFSGPVRKLISSLQKKILGNIYAIQSNENGIDLNLENVSVLNGTFDDMPVKDNHLDLLIVTGNITSECLDSCLSEWRRVVNRDGTLAIVTPTAVIADYRDPLDIGEFIEQREHPRLESAENLNLDILSNEMAKYFENIETSKVVHITVLRATGPNR